MSINKMFQYLEGAKNCVQFANLQEGEEVLILAEPDADLKTIEMLSLFCKEKKTNVHVLFKERTEFGKEQSRIVTEALKATDTVFDIGYPVAHSKAGFISSLDYGTKNIIVRPDVEVFATEAAKFPIDLWYEMGKWLHKKIRQNPYVRITDEKGTNFEIHIAPETVGGFVGPVPFEPGIAVPGYIAPFPLGATIWGDANYSANGLLCLDSAYNFGKISEPVKWKVEKGWVVDFEGYGAGTFKDIVRRSKNANRIGKMGFGMNPKVIPDFDGASVAVRASKLFYSTRRAGAFMCAMGSNALAGGKDWSPQVPIYGILIKPTVYLGDELYIENGHCKMFEDPSIIKKAEEFGDPEKIFAVEDF